MERREATGGASDGPLSTPSSRAGDDPALFTVGMVTIGLVVGVFVGLMVWSLVASDEADSGTDGVQEDLDALSSDVGAMTALVDLLDERASGSAGELEATRHRLDGMRADLEEVGATLAKARAELDRRAGSISGASEDLSDLGGELEDVRMDLVALQLELEDLIAQIIAGGGSGGNGTTVPENATLLASPHLAHYQSPYLVFSCGICHDAEPAGEVVVSRGRMYWNGSLDDPGFNTVINRTAECIECHGQFPETVMDPSYIDVSCVVCHEDWADRMTAPYVREAAVTDDDCLLCHGGPNAFIADPQDY